MKPPNFFPKKTPFSQHFVIIALFPVTFFSYLKEKGDSFTKTVAHSRFQFSTSSSLPRTKSIQRGILSVLASALRSYGKRLVRIAHFGVFQPLLQKRLIIKGLRIRNHIFRRSLKKVSFIKEISYDFSSFIKENVVSLHPD